MSTRVRNIFIFLTRNLLPVKTTNHFNNGDKKFSYQLNKEVMTIKNINGETVYKSAFNKLSRSILKGLE
jgi:hypothetical protein